MSLLTRPTAMAIFYKTPRTMNQREIISFGGKFVVHPFLRKDWIDATAIARRALTPKWIAFLRGRRYNRTKLSPKEAGAKKSSGQNAHSSSTTIAKDSGVDEGTVRRDGVFVTAIETINKNLGNEVEIRIMDDTLAPISQCDGG